MYAMALSMAWMRDSVLLRFYDRIPMPALVGRRLASMEIDYRCDGYQTSSPAIKACCQEQSRPFQEFGNPE